MYAILSHGGHQYRVAPGDRLLVDRLASEPGSVVELEPVLFVGAEKDGAAGSSEATGARVSATVIAHRRGPKLRVFKYKAKKRYRKTHGHRSDLTELRIDGLLKAGQSAKTSKSTAAPAAASSGE